MFPQSSMTARIVANGSDTHPLLAKMSRSPSVDLETAAPTVVDDDGALNHRALARMHSGRSAQPDLLATSERTQDSPCPHPTRRSSLRGFMSDELTKGLQVLENLVVGCEPHTGQVFTKQLEGPLLIHRVELASKSGDHETSRCGAAP